MKISLQIVGKDLCQYVFYPSNNRLNYPVINYLFGESICINYKSQRCFEKSVDLIKAKLKTENIKVVNIEPSKPKSTPVKNLLFDIKL